jgi:hypothetical protein
MEFWGAVIVIYGLWLLLSAIGSALQKALDNKKNKLNELRIKEYELNEKDKKLDDEIEYINKILDENYRAIEIIYNEKSQGFPWLAKAYAEYSILRDQKTADRLKTKKYPAPKAAEQLREIAKEKSEAKRQYRISKYLLEMYESLFPFLIDFRGEDLDDYIRVSIESNKRGEGFEDEVMAYTTEGERRTLNKQEIFQRALDRYWQKKKRPWELGRDYERYIGWLYEMEGYSVYYQGIVEGLEDLGRDLIIKKGSEIGVIQCKYWSQYKTIHEKHICQLFGTTLKYWVEHQRKKRMEGRTRQYTFPELIQKKERSFRV